MFSSGSCTHHVKRASRCLSASKATPEAHRFWVGTCALREENELQLVEYNEDSRALEVVQVVQHPEGEVWDMAPHPKDPQLMLTCYNTGSERGGALWRLPAANERDGDDGVGLTRIAELRHGGTDVDKAQRSGNTGVVGAQWSVPDAKQVISLHADGRFVLWDASRAGSLSAVDASKPPNAGGDPQQHLPRAVRFDPLQPHEAVVAQGSNLVGLDTRAGLGTPKFVLPSAHTPCVRDIDYNSNKPHFLVTGGDDSMVKFWDVRITAEPVKVLSGHAHWVMQTKYNPFHDQLVLSASSDTVASLWRVSSISASPLVGADEEDELLQDLDERASAISKESGGVGAASSKSGDSSAADALIKVYNDDHEESVYGAAWSAMDAWVFATLSYEGRLVINSVPTAEKYKILL